jgi:hypothetical protein
MLFLVVAAAAATPMLIVAAMTRGVTFFSTATDNERQVYTAAQAGRWRWPSEMHAYGGGKTRMKDAVVLALAIAQRVLGDRTTDYPLIVLSLVANAVSAVLVFLVAQAYWGTAVALAVFALFLTSFWSYQIALFGGHICTAQMFFLGSVLLMHRAESGSPSATALWHLASGVSIGLMLFASASSRKYVPLLAGAFLYSQRAVLAIPSEVELRELLLRLLRPEVGVVTGALGLFAVTSYVGMRHLARRLFLGRAPAWIDRVLPRSSAGSWGRYQAWAGKMTRFLWGLSVVLFIDVLIGIVLDSPVRFYLAQLWVAFGIVLVAAIFTYPDVIGNLRGYLAYWDAPKEWGHFRLYREYFAKVGKPIPADMRGAGWNWVVRFFWRVAPFHSICLILAAGVVGLLAARAAPQHSIQGAAVILLGISPILVGELTRGPQIGRSYYPGFIAVLLVVGYGAFLVNQWLAGPSATLFWSAAALFVSVAAAWNAWIFVDDVWRARMAPAFLARALEALGARWVYTYDIAYNDAFVSVLPSDVCREIEVRFVSRLDEAGEGYVVVPGTSSKALNMESQRTAIEHGDFRQDPLLNHLIESREITWYAVASFKTFGTSRMWPHESEVTSYRDLILGEIDEADRWRGRAWILDTARLRAEWPEERRRWLTPRTTRERPEVPASVRGRPTDGEARSRCGG